VHAEDLRTADNSRFVAGRSLTAPVMQSGTLSAGRDESISAVLSFRIERSNRPPVGRSQMRPATGARALSDDIHPGDPHLSELDGVDLRQTTATANP